MYQSINFKDGSLIFISDEEKDIINPKLLNNDKFIEITRLKLTINTDTISFVGENSLFKLPEVKDIPKENFGFTDTNVYAVSGSNYWKYLGKAGWDVSTKEEFEESSDFNGFINK